MLNLYLGRTRICAIFDLNQTQKKNKNDVEITFWLQKKNKNDHELQIYLAKF